MTNYNKTAFTLLILIAVVAVVAAMTLPGQTQKESSSAPQTTAKGRDLPIVDYGVPEIADPQTQTKRKTKGRRHDGQSSQPIEEAPSSSGRVWSSHWSRGLPAIPVQQSDVVLVGQILDAQAYLSNDKTGIYSEFTVRVEEETLKGDALALFPSGITTIERSGGAVRFPSGVIQRYVISAQGMPRIGCRYVLFAKRINQEEDYTLITGYELRGDKVFPLDGSIVEEGTQKFPFDDYEGFDASVFLSMVKDAVAKTPSGSLQGER